MRRSGSRGPALLIMISLAAIILFILLSPPVLAFFLKLFSIVPSFEGLAAGVEGAETDAGYLRIDGGRAGCYEWISSDPRNAVLKKDCWMIYSEGAVRVEVSQPREVVEWFSSRQKIHYWVKVSDNPFQAVEVEGEVVVYEAYVTVSALNREGVDEWFKGERIWLALTSLTWNRAYQKQGAEYGQAWEAPLAVIIESYSIRDAGEHGKIEPSVSGRWITLYNSPEQKGTISDLGVLMGANLNESLAGDPSPDTRIRRTAYFAFTLTDFGVEDHLLWFSAPVADYKLKIYALRIGKFTYTNPDKTPWAQRPPEKDIFDWIAEALGLPASILGWGLVIILLFMMFMIALVIVAAVALRLGVSPRRHIFIKCINTFLSQASLNHVGG